MEEARKKRKITFQKVTNAYDRYEAEVQTLQTSLLAADNDVAEATVLLQTAVATAGGNGLQEPWARLGQLPALPPQAVRACPERKRWELPALPCQQGPAAP